LRGYEFDFVWADELCKWKYQQETWDMMKFALRSGSKPRVIVTTTLKPIKTIKDLLSDPYTVVTTGSTFENTSLPEAFVDHIRTKYDGTRLGRQELHAELLADNMNALWNRKNIDAYRAVKSPELKRLIVAIDPATTNTNYSDETGIIVAGVDQYDEGYILEDLSLKASPQVWAQVAITAYHKHEADLIIVEANQGGDMVETTLRMVDPNIPIKKVHASRGKVTRAEPISAKYEQERCIMSAFSPSLRISYASGSRE
jgi:phage terminase large subunit-like protein